MPEQVYNLNLWSLNLSVFFEEQCEEPVDHILSLSFCLITVVDLN